MRNLDFSTKVFLSADAGSPTLSVQISRADEGAENSQRANC